MIALTCADNYHDVTWPSTRSQKFEHEHIQCIFNLHRISLIWSCNIHEVSQTHQTFDRFLLICKPTHCFHWLKLAILEARPWCAAALYPQLTCVTCNLNLYIWDDYTWWGGLNIVVEDTTNCLTVAWAITAKTRQAMHRKEHHLKMYNTWASRDMIKPWYCIGYWYLHSS